MLEVFASGKTLGEVFKLLEVKDAEELEAWLYCEGIKGWNPLAEGKKEEADTLCDMMSFVEADAELEMELPLDAEEMFVGVRVLVEGGDDDDDDEDDEREEDDDSEAEEGEEDGGKDIEAFSAGICRFLLLLPPCGGDVAEMDALRLWKPIGPAPAGLFELVEVELEEGLKEAGNDAEVAVWGIDR